ncbi:hypothetical protein CCACVL1_26382 [Corchorus capsularis]|uniref:Uncharacterized protein n=1 Tax=Corchorus capsularis TaxID=210143 RepID=A0A1R3GF11_COCAP|nr:hypothetical protein CCACVL1_26382 [Corchorus capsularis]
MEPIDEWKHQWNRMTGKKSQVNFGWLGIAFTFPPLTFTSPFGFFDCPPLPASFLPSLPFSSIDPTDPTNSQAFHLQPSPHF